MKHVTKLLLLIALPFIVKGQSADRRVALMLGGGITQYNGDLGQNFYSFKTQSVKGHGAGSISFYANKSFDVMLNGSYGHFGHWENWQKNFLTKLGEGSLNLKYKLNNGYILKEEARLAPYLFAGIGGYNIKTEVSKIDDKTDRTISTENGLEPYFSFGGGFNIRLTDGISLILQESFGYLSKDNYDAENVNNSNNANKINDAFLRHTAGLQFSFGKSKPKAPKIVDTDLDGIPDNIDNCPNEKGPQATSGCPDSDGDGIADKADECVNLAGVVALNGCPDTDGDGVADAKDRCPKLAGVAENNGCPLDSDNDGIYDSEDNCPREKGTVSNKGCPEEKDTDGDGIADKADKCPTVKGVIANNGCPEEKDTDGDGILDKVDQCPTVKGVIANNGCPEVKQEVKQIFNEALQGIQFETGSAVIKSTSFGILDKVVRVMNENATFNLLINGHTDSQGADAANLTLSQKRADAVKAYLVSKGIKASRLTATGYGETVPVADNATPAGRAQNRRVEFVVKF